jgi:hypothetical protein
MRAAITKLSPLRVGMPVMCAMLAVAASLASAQQATAPFHLQEATIGGIQAATHPPNEGPPRRKVNLSPE